MVKHLGDGPKLVVDTLSVGVLAGTLVDALPSIAAIFSILWAAISIWETKTVQSVVAWIVAVIAGTGAAGGE